ncbi:MAG: signal peptidase II [Deltaproteobacteria bacterium]|nr:signal peptidase II [Deltaproteobacteria bacterium]
MMKSLMKLKYLVLLAVTGTIISLDQLTKQLVTQRFHVGESTSVISGLFNLTYVRNPGAAFGLLGHWDASLRVPFFIIVPLIALGVIFYVFRKVEDTDLKLSAALSLVIGGAFGNLIDRAAYNYVVDFLDFHWDDAHFPAFNVADMAICVGVGFLIIDIIIKEKNQRAKLEDVPHTS